MNGFDRTVVLILSMAVTYTVLIAGLILSVEEEAGCGASSRTVTARYDPS